MPRVSPTRGELVDSIVMAQLIITAVGPVLLYGGGLDVTLVPLALLSVAANVYLVYLLFRASTEFHGPRIRLAREGQEEGPDEPGTRS